MPEFQYQNSSVGGSITGSPAVTLNVMQIKLTAGDYVEFYVQVATDCNCTAAAFNASFLG